MTVDELTNPGQNQAQHIYCNYCLSGHEKGPACESGDYKRAGLRGEGQYQSVEDRSPQQ
jgi:hypothetical protein